MLERFDTFVTHIARINRNLQRIKNQEMTEFQLKGIHVMCIFKLYHNPDGLTLTRLAALCCEDKAAMSRIVTELTGRGLICSDTNVKYRAPLFLTDEGLKIAVEIDKMVCNAVLNGGDGLTEEEREIFYKALNHISENLETYLKG